MMTTKRMNYPMKTTNPETFIDPERGGWTSASSAERHAACPGSFLLEVGIAPDPSSADAERGTRIAAALAAGTPDGSENSPTLVSEEFETYEMCLTMRQKITTAWGGKCDVKRAEERYWLEWESPTGKTLKHSGKADLVVIDGDRALIIDDKSGRNAVSASPRNLQLRHLAVLVAACEPGVAEVTVAIDQPWASSEVELCFYTLDDLVVALDELHGQVEANHDPKSPRNPGEHCQYCRAKRMCVEFMAASLPVPVPPESMPAAVQIEEAIARLPGNRLGPFLGLVRLASEAAELEVRNRLKDGIPVDGWHMAPGRTTETITDVQTCFDRFMAEGGTQSQFLRIVKVDKTHLKEHLRGLTGLKGKALDGKLATMIEGITESKTSQPILERT